MDRTDYDLLLSKITKWCNNIRRICPDFMYLIVPEMHLRIEENGKRAFHFHGLIANCEGLNIIPSIDKRGKQRITKSGLPRYEIKNYKLGFSDATPIQDTYKVSSYILKYVTKAECCVNKGKKRFIHSNNLNRPKETVYYSDTKSLFTDEFNNANYISKKFCKVGIYQQEVTYYHFIPPPTNALTCFR